MKPLTFPALAVLVLAGVLIARALGGREGRAAGAAALTDGLPSGAVVILDARPFALDEPFVHEWRAEKPLVSAGYLLALEVDPELGRPRQSYEPVLYAGSQTLERCSTSEDGSVVIAIVPAPLDAEGRVELDLATTPLWFGSLELPERVDAARIARELAIARAAGIGPARRATGTLRTAPADTIYGRTRRELDAYVAEWAELYGR